MKELGPLLGITLLTTACGHSLPVYDPGIYEGERSGADQYCLDMEARAGDKESDHQIVYWPLATLAASAAAAGVIVGPGDGSNRTDEYRRRDAVLLATSGVLGAFAIWASARVVAATNVKVAAADAVGRPDALEKCRAAYSYYENSSQNELSAFYYKLQKPANAQRPEGGEATDKTPAGSTGKQAQAGDASERVKTQGTGQDTPEPAPKSSPAPPPTLAPPQPEPAVEQPDPAQ